MRSAIIYMLAIRKMENDQKDSGLKKKRNIILCICTILFAARYFILRIENFIEYIVIVGLLVAGLMTIINYYNDLPIDIGCSGKIPAERKFKNQRLIAFVFGVFFFLIGIFFWLHKYAEKIING